MGLRLPKSPKIAVFGINLPLEKIQGVRRETWTTRNLSLCNGTIIVLKITLLHGVSVITNFVIPKRDRKKTTRKQNEKNEQKNYTFLSTAGAQPTIPTILGTVIKEVRTIFVPPNFF